jgi:putative tryptophan/tyrosine transport system substrate-binding protein
MRRREALALMGGVAGLPLAVRAQHFSPPRIGWMSMASPEDAESSPFFEAFRGGLRDLGYVEGENLRLEPRWARGDPERGTALAKDLVRLGVAAIVSQGTAIRVVRPVAGSVPVIFGISGDPEKAGLVQSLARPGGNFTGATFMSYELNTKRLEVLKEVLPAASRIVLLTNPEHPGESGELEVSRKTAEVLGLAVHYVPVRSAQDLEPAFGRIAKQSPEALIALPDALVMQHRARLIGFANGQGIPAVSGWSDFARSGGLFTYGPDLRESFRILARSVDKVLKGATPAEIPVEQPTKFELVINLKTANALGLTISPTLLARADEVIE